MEVIEQQISCTSKQLEEDDYDCSYGDDDDDKEDAVNDCDDAEREKPQDRHNQDHRMEGRSAMSVKKNMQKQDAVFKKACNKLTKMIWDSVHAQDSVTNT